MKKAVVLSNMGGARSPQELKLFLKNMFSDKRIIPGWMRFPIAALLPSYRYKKVWKDYEKIGGSHIYSHTKNLIKHLKPLLDIDTLMSMRYTHPFLNEVSKDYDELIIFPMYPHFSSTTTGSIWDEVEEMKFEGKITIIPEFYKNKKFNQLIAESILKEVDDPSEFNLVFSAHGLPEYITKKGDPYIQQVYEHVELLQKLLPGFKSVSVGFQSRIGPVKWQKPYLEEVLSKFKNEKVIVYPISFLIDNSETDFELKIEYAEIAKKYGVKSYKVIDCLNDKKEFAELIAGIIKKYL
jgi:ferrochelatase